jgi:Zn-dependent protease
MSQCYICGVDEGIPFKCNYCQESFCNDHRNPFNHSCPFIDKYTEKREKRKDVLLGKGHDIGNGGSSILNSISRAIRIKSSKTELLHLSVAALLVTAVGLSLNNYRYISWQFLAIFLSAFLVHELAHKFLAQFYGSWAEFRAQMYGLIVTAISALPIMPFKFIAPGAVMVGISDRNRFGRVAFIGPLTNLVMGFALLALSSYYYPYYPYLAAGASFNGWIAIFNLMPFGMLDGQKIFDWNKVVWGLTMATAMGLFILGYI